MRYDHRTARTLPLAFERVPDLPVVFGGAFGDPDRSGVDRHTFTRSAVTWMTFPPGVRLHEKRWLG